MTWRVIPFFLHVIFGTLACSVLAILAARIRRDDGLVHRISRFWARMFFKTTGSPYTLVHTERIPSDPGYIIMANHKSHLDPPLIIASFPHHIRFLTKIELFSIPVFGTALETIGHIAIDRRNHESALRSLRLAGEKIRAGTTILAFPEGTRFPGEGLGPLKKGAFHLALESRVPVLPIWIEGTGKVLPKGSSRPHPGPITAIIGEPISAEDVAAADLESLMKTVKTRLEALAAEAAEVH